MKFKTSSTFKSLINAVGKIEHLKPHNRINTVDALRLPSYYDKHKNLSLYSGEWRHVNCDCIHFDDEVALRRELALARIAKYNPLLKQEINRKPAQESKDSSTHSVLEIEGYYPHINMVSYGNLQEVEQELLKLDKRRGQKSA
ncbi:hypothetical protein BgAZ_304690 [Babesia gibsoni]|uniref:Uncharacterized protein n=1 Tax=Babesia gibsoni TaxID=33632 RepID=A0AAD8PE00_BABGI|nr:hypothetical protein BgAZ_304690 [Babesia gibsoni]